MRYSYPESRTLPSFAVRFEDPSATVLQAPCAEYSRTPSAKRNGFVNCDGKTLRNTANICRSGGGRGLREPHERVVAGCPISGRDSGSVIQKLNPEVGVILAIVPLEAT